MTREPPTAARIAEIRERHAVRDCSYAFTTDLLDALDYCRETLLSIDALASRPAVNRLAQDALRRLFREGLQ